MELSDGLREILSKFLGWNKCRLDCFVGMLLALMRIKQINLTQLAVAFSSDVALKTRYRRLQRFFQQVVFDYDVIARLIMQMFDFDETSYYITIDRTNWKWGEDKSQHSYIGYRL